ncbi:MAG: malectin domain-containing carbohydrate-binding protein [Dehalococcoidia bacterium]|nr:malectin domain-containing carbohydrate-binding protein [Dehalococcoidia bacterium]
MSGGNTFSSSSSIETDDLAPEAVFQSERWGEQDWALPIANGTYTVQLYFAEIYSGAFDEGARVFDVAIEGEPVLNDLDVFAEVGAETGLVQGFTTEVSDGQLDISFDAEVQNPKVSGIVVTSGAAPEPTPTPASTATPEPTATATPEPTSTPTPTATPPADGGSGDDWTIGASVESSTVDRGDQQTIRVQVESQVADRGLVDVEVYDADGNRIFQKYWDDRQFQSGESRTFLVRGSIPGDAATGEYVVKVGIFEPQPAWGTFLALEDPAATFTVE